MKIIYRGKSIEGRYQNDIIDQILFDEKIDRITKITVKIPYDNYSLKVVSSTDHITEDDAIISWGDGSGNFLQISEDNIASTIDESVIGQENEDPTVHIYNKAGIYDISGHFTFGKSSAPTDSMKECLVEVKNLTAKSDNLGGAFNGCENLRKFSIQTQLSPINTRYMFNNCANLIKADVAMIDMTNVTDAMRMFSNCNMLTTLDVSNWNTGNIKHIGWMFWRCYELTTLDVSNWNTSNVTNMSFMFVHCNSLTSLDLSNWDTSNVTVMRNMFYGCKSLTSLDVSNFNTSKVTTMNSMFYNCNKLTSLDLSNFNTINVTNSTSMFEGCNALKYIGMLYSDKNSCNKIKDELPDITGLKRAIYVQDTKFYEYENTNYLEFRDYKEQKIIVYLPQPLRSIGEYKDKFYWDEGKGKYCIEQWVAIPEGYNETLNESLILETPIIIETDITEKINFDTTISYIQVITDEYKIQPSNITIEASMAEKIEGEGE